MRSRKWVCPFRDGSLGYHEAIDLLYGAMQGVELAAKENASSAGECVRLLAPNVDRSSASQSP